MFLLPCDWNVSFTMRLKCFFYHAIELFLLPFDWNFEGFHISHISPVTTNNEDDLCFWILWVMSNPMIEDENEKEIKVKEVMGRGVTLGQKILS